jgi:YgiT-type zinc finger domain-containing protein
MDETEGGQVRVQAQVRTWRREHPHATLTEIEAALDSRLFAFRGQLLEELATANPAAGMDGGDPADRPRCPCCGNRAVREGQRERRLTTTGEQAITLRRTYVTCTTCGAGFFPPG